MADFDLAVKALDSYIEIVTAAKERAEKSAESGELEKDEILLQTLSEGVTLLTCHGSFEEAEKARDLTDMIREYVDKHTVPVVNGEVNGNSSKSSDIPVSVLAMSYRAVGVGLANWASWTPVNESRDEIRADAIDYLEKSLEPELDNSSSYSSLYTLGLVLAENRDLDTAIDYIKSALTPSGPSVAIAEDLSKERDLVSLWHLLALLLSAKQEFEIAGRSCEAAFEPFPKELFSKGHRERRSSRHSHNSGTQRPLLTRLSGREKERIIQTRITQLAFVELLDGPEAAVNHSEQLLSLFGTLFHDLSLETGESKCKSKTLCHQKALPALPRASVVVSSVETKRLSYQTDVPIIPMVLTFSHPHQLFPMVLQRKLPRSKLRTEMIIATRKRPPQLGGQIQRDLKSEVQASIGTRGHALKNLRFLGVKHHQI